MIKSKIILLLSILYFMSLVGCASHSRSIVLYSGEVDLILDDNCTMVGRIVDIETKRPIVGASIYFENTNIGGSSGDHGNYSIGRISPGVHDIRVSCIGFELLKISNFNFEKNHYYLVDFELVEELPVLPE